MDRLGRPLRSLRVSLIDMCNLRCNYCMPADEYVWLPREDILSVDEIVRLVAVFSEAGVDKAPAYFLASSLRPRELTFCNCINYA